MHPSHKIRAPFVVCGQQYIVRAHVKTNVKMVLGIDFVINRTCTFKLDNITIYLHRLGYSEPVHDRIRATTWERSLAQDFSDTKTYQYWIGGVSLRPRQRESIFLHFFSVSLYWIKTTPNFFPNTLTNSFIFLVQICLGNAQHPLLNQVFVSGALTISWPYHATERTTPEANLHKWFG